MKEPSNDRGVVLIVEDEPLIRMAAAAMIADMGFESLEARDADEAMRILRARSDIGFLFTDIDMPGSMDGLALAQRVHDIWPPMKILMTSGHVNLKAANIPDGAQFVSKPYSPSSVTQILTRLAA